ncbi:MAG: hypothetical protein D6731_01370 [Planctomycetota bacterium]|nr:MAG: hypothetical protein D6731_01370 [Planctomycetota bacterium]
MPGLRRQEDGLDDGLRPDPNLRHGGAAEGGDPARGGTRAPRGGGRELRGDAHREGERGGLHGEGGPPLAGRGRRPATARPAPRGAPLRAAGP